MPISLSVDSKESVTSKSRVPLHHIRAYRKVGNLLDIRESFCVLFCLLKDNMPLKNFEQIIGHVVQQQREVEGRWQEG